MKINKIVKILTILISIYYLIGFFVFPYFLRPQIIKIINENITKEVFIKNIKLNPFTFEININEFEIKDKEKLLIYFKNLYLDFSLFKTIDKNHIRFEEINLTDAIINIIEDEKGTINLTQLIKKNKEKKTNSSILDFLILKTSINNTTINYTKNSKLDPFSISFSNLNYHFYDLGSFKNIVASQTLSTKINENTHLNMKGGFKLKPFSMYANVSLENLKPNEFLSYKQSMLNFALDDKASIDLNFGYQISLNDSLNLKVQNLNLNLRDIDLKQKNDTLTKFETLLVKNLSLEYPKQKINIETISLEKPYFNMIINKNNKLNFSTLIKTIEKKTSLKDEEKLLNNWFLDLKAFNLLKGNLQYSDMNNNLKFENLSFNVNNLKLEKEDLKVSAITLTNPSIKINNKKDKFNLDINNLSLIATNLTKEKEKILLDTIELKKDKLFFNKELHTKITGKNISLTVDKFKKQEEKLEVSTITLTNPNIKINSIKDKSKLDINNLSLIATNLTKEKEKILLDTIKLKKENLFLEKELKTEVITKNIDLIIDKITFENNTLAIKSTKLQKPYVSIAIFKDSENEKVDTKETNLIKNKTSNKNLNLDIGPIKIVDASFNFEDKNLPIPFNILVSNLDGNFSEFNSKSSKPTKLNLEGTVDKYGYAKISGLVEHQNIKNLTDINMIFKNINIKNLTSYSGKFLGKKIDSGKLNLDLKYNIKNSNLNAKNSIVINNIKLGEKVESKDAISIPLELAIALLEDSKGVINLDIPISGNVSDPNFSIAPIIWKAFTNLVVKAVSAPFKFLASLLGVEAEEIKTIDFEYASSKLLSSEKETLNNLILIMEKRPHIAIKIIPNHSLDDIKALQNLKTNLLIEEQIKKISNGDKYQIAIENLYSSYKNLKNLKKIKKEFIVIENRKEIFLKDKYLASLKEHIALKQTITKEELKVLTQNRIKNILDYFKTKKIDNTKIIIGEERKSNSNKNFTSFNLEIAIAE